MFIVRFVRRDTQPVEEYFYNSLNDALYHFHLYRNDTTGLYYKIDLLFYSEELSLEEVLHTTSFVESFS